MSNQTSIPKDILKRLQQDFSNEQELEESIKIVNQIRLDNNRINVGWVQLSRAIILIANGDLNEMKSIIESNYRGDPRDVIMEMMSIEGTNNHYGLSEF